MILSLHQEDTNQILLNNFRDQKGWKGVAVAAKTVELERNLIIILTQFQFLSPHLRVEAAQITEVVPTVQSVFLSIFPSSVHTFIRISVIK